MIFTNPDVAAKYDSAFDVDRYLHIPCTFTGKLSDINMQGADKIYEQGSNLVTLKPVSKPFKVLPKKAADTDDENEN